MILSRKPLSHTLYVLFFLAKVYFLLSKFLRALMLYRKQFQTSIVQQEIPMLEIFNVRSTSQLKCQENFQIYPYFMIG